MSVDNLIRLKQIESGELIDFINDNGNFYSSSDPSGLATKDYVSGVSGEINSSITTVTSNLDSTGQTILARESSIQGFPTGSSGQLQYSDQEGKFGAADYLFYNYQKKVKVFQILLYENN